MLERKPTGFGAKTGPPSGSHTSLGCASGSTIIPHLSVGSCVRWAGACSSRSNAPPSATKQRSRHGGKSDGPRSKKAAAERRSIVWIDQSGFYVVPMAVRTYAPRGQTPILRVPLTRDHLSAISAITPQGRLFMQLQVHAYDSFAVV